MHPCPAAARACPGGSTGREARRAAPPASCGRCAARRASRPVDYLDKRGRRRCTTSMHDPGQDDLSPGEQFRMSFDRPGTAQGMARRHGSRRRAQWHGGSSRSLPERAFAGVEELNEMTIGRTDDPVNPTLAMALEAASLFGIGSRNPSGPAASVPRQQAGHMTAIEPPVGLLIFLLHPRGRPHMRAQRSNLPRAFVRSLGEIASSLRA